MLIEFSVSNFWSFRTLQTLTLQAARIISKDTKLDEQNIIKLSDDLSLLKTKAIFGANASGKSNVIKALVSMLTVIDACFANERIIEKAVVPFNLNITRPQEPTFFQLVFSLNGMIYRYGFEVLSNKVVSEWLFGKLIERGNSKKLTEKYLFKRDGMKVTVNQATFKEGKRFDSAVNPVFRENSLFLRVMSALNGELSKTICAYLNSFEFIGEYPEKQFYHKALSRLDNHDFLKKLTVLVQAVDPSINKIDVRSSSQENDFLEPLVQRSYPDKSTVSFPLLKIEAEGTKKIFGLSPFIFDAIEKGTVLVIDEFDARLHSKLTRKIIEMFHSPYTNPKSAQLIFVSHDTNLLDNTLLRRDQILFANKGKDGATELYSLVEIKGVRNDNLYEREYLLGRYKAVPNNLNVLGEPFKFYGNAKKD